MCFNIKMKTNVFCDFLCATQPTIPIIHNNMNRIGQAPNSNRPPSLQQRWGHHPTPPLTLSRSTSTQGPSIHTCTGAPLGAPWRNRDILQERLHHLEAHTSHTSSGCEGGCLLPWMQEGARCLMPASGGTQGNATTTTCYYSPLAIIVIT